jgi:hypothetical protein
MKNVVKEEQVLYNAKGKKTHVLLPFAMYSKLVEQLEDAMDLLSMKEVEHEPDISFEEVKKKLARKKR